MKKIVVPFLAVGLFLTCSAVFAHHGFGVAYDMEAPITQTATMNHIVWTNPHVEFYYDVKDEQGNVTTWIAEMTNPRGLERMGFTKDTVKPGDAITITVNPAKSKAPRGLILKMLDGDKLVYNNKQPIEGLLAN